MGSWFEGGDDFDVSALHVAVVRMGVELIATPMDSSRQSNVPVSLPEKDRRLFESHQLLLSVRLKLERLERGLHECAGDRLSHNQGSRLPWCMAPSVGMHQYCITLIPASV